MHAMKNMENIVVGKYLVVVEYVRLDIIMTVIYCYLERENYKVLKVDMNNFFYF